MEQNSLSYEEKLYAQIEDAYGKLLYTYTTQLIHAGRINRNNHIFKWAQIILSAISTGGFIGTIVSSETALIWVGGLCSTALLVLTAYLKDNNLATLYLKHLDTANKLWIQREQYLSLLTDCTILCTDEIVLRRDALQEKTASVYDTAPITDDKSFEIAKKSLKENEAQFFTRDELNYLLPLSLRK